MKVRIAVAILAVALPSALAAQEWKEIDRLTGDVAVELDEASVTKAMDGANEVLQATFRRQMPTGPMESDVAIDCGNATARLRAIRLINADGSIYNQPMSQTLDYSPISFGSSDAIYYKALCGKDIEPPEGYATDDAPVLEDASPGENAHPLNENPVLEDAEDTGAQ